jgi:glycosyltransferase involved in cell wall biosynthesis
VRVVYVIDNLGSGGAQRQAVELAVALRTQLGVAARLMVYREVDASIDRGLFVERLEAAGVPVWAVPKRRRLDATLHLRMGRWIADAEPHLVHAFMAIPALHTLLALRLTRQRPVLLGAERSSLANSGRLERWLQGIVYRRCDGVTVNSRPALEELASVLRVPRERLHYLPNGIDLEAWDRAARRPVPFELEPGCFHAALVGRFGLEKNHALLLEALGRLDRDVLRRWRVWFVGAKTGESGTLEALEGEIRRRGLEGVVRFAAPTADIAALMRRLDLLVLPSKYEGFPNVVLEAMASGVPVVAAPVGDVPSLVCDGETGFLFASEDADALARALARVGALASEERAALGARARRLVESRFRIDALAQAHLTLYRTLVGRHDAKLATTLP